MQLGAVYTVSVLLQCRQACRYVKTEFPHYSVFVKTLLLWIFKPLMHVCLH